MKINLQTKITIIYALIFSFVIIALNAAVYLSVRFFESSNSNTQIQKTRVLVDELITTRVSFNQDDLKSLGIMYPIVVKIESGDREIYSADGIKLVSSGNRTKINLNYLNSDETQNAVVTKYEVLGQNSVKYKVTIARTSESNIYNNRMIVVTNAITSILGIILSLTAGSYLSQQTLEPISNIRRSVEAIRADSLHDRIRVPDTGDELTDLGNTFNSLLDRLDEAYQRQAKFVSDASHELRTPLTVIKGYNDMLSRWGKSDPEVLDEAISSIKEETENMSNLVENLLFIAKGENKKLNVTPERFDLMALINETTVESQMAHPLKNITCDGKSFDIFADKKMIKQMLRVFIENSIKFTDENGQIRLSLSRAGATNLKIKIWDNGDGIPPEDIDKIFQRFYVADKARTKDKSGSGLGLSIAKWIADVHRGEITVKSELGKYTEFTVLLPDNLKKAENLKTV